MSVNITVSGNLMGLPPRRTILSDVQQLKKTEQNHRKRLRLEQVRQQSKERSSKILGRAKLIERQELEKLQNDKDSDLRLLHNQRLQIMQQKYRDDMENIGQAHIDAARQPNADEVLEECQKRNRAIAKKRGREATRCLKETTKKEEEERNATKNRLRNIRESENTRASIISQLPRMFSNSDNTSSVSDYDENVVIPGKKNVMLVTAMVHQADDSNPNQSNRQVKRSKNVTNEVANNSNIPRSVLTCESDDQEPRRTVPVINLPASKADKIACYNPDDYRQPTSEESISICSSNSQDSLQSTVNQEPLSSRKTQKLHTTPATHRVNMYNLSSRKHDKYTVPSGVVEKINTYDQPNAEDEAKEITRSESYFSQLSKIRKAAAENRGKDALLREKVRRDYDQLMQSLDHYCSEERKLKASQVQNSPMHNLHMHPSRKKDCLRKRQNKMERKIESTMRTKRPTMNTEKPPVTNSERIITAEINTGTKLTEEISSSSGQSIVNTNAASTSANQSLHYEQILGMLLKLEQTKYELWLEYGTSLPKSISTAVQRPLWQQQLTTLLKDTTSMQQKQKKQETQEQLKETAHVSPEIKVINVSLENEVKKKKKKKDKSKVSPQLTETAVQTSVTIQDDDAQDKSVQVEMSKEQEQILCDAARNERRRVLEPTIKVIAQTENVDSGSSVSTVTDTVIDMDERQVKVTPKRTNKRRKLSVVTRKSLSSRSLRKTPSTVARKSLRDSSKATFKETADKATSFRMEDDIENKTSIESSCNSTEISQVYSATNVTPIEGTPYTIRTHQTKRILKIRQTSDSSTSYASPPIVRPGAYLPTANTSTPVLEILDSSKSGTEKIRKSNVSPVSSPETPSPRTMKLASNIPRRTSVSKSLFKRNEKYERMQTDQNSEDWQNKNIGTVSQPQECLCTNPSCQLYHSRPMFTNANDVYSHEINKKLEELQKKTKGKIASIAELLERLRNLDSVILTDMPSADSSFANLQIAQNLIKEIEMFHEVLKKNLKESQKLVNIEAGLSSVSPVASTPRDTNNEQGDDHAFDMPVFNKPKIISDKRILIEQNESTPLNDKDESLGQLVTEILAPLLTEKQNENGDKPVAMDSDESLGKKFDKLSCLQNIHLKGSQDVPSTSASNGKEIYGRELLPPNNELSIIKEFDTTDTTGRVPSNPPFTFKTPFSLDTKKIPTPRTSTPTKSQAENKSTYVATRIQKLPENSDSSSPNQPEESSSNPTYSDNKKSSSDLSGFSGISKIDSQTSVEKQLFEKVPWAGATVKKTRQSAALDSSSTSDAVPLNIAPRSLVSNKKLAEHSGHHEFSGLTDVSSISLRNANKSTEQSVLQRARTSTPNIRSSATTDCSDMTTSPSIELT